MADNAIRRLPSVIPLDDDEPSPAAPPPRLPSIIPIDDMTPEESLNARPAWAERAEAVVNAAAPASLPPAARRAIMPPDRVSGTYNTFRTGAGDKMLPSVGEAELANTPVTGGPGGAAQDYAEQAFTAASKGALSMIPSAIGMVAPDTANRMQGNLDAKYGNEDTISNTIASGVGSGAAFLPAQLAGGPAAALALGFASGAGGGRMEAAQQRSDYLLSDGQQGANPSGLAEATHAVASGLAEGIPEMLGAKFSKGLGHAIERNIAPGASRVAAALGAELAEEPIEEGATEIADNVSARLTGVDPTRGTLDNVGKAMLGGLGGGISMTPYALHHARGAGASDGQQQVREQERPLGQSPDAGNAPVQQQHQAGAGEDAGAPQSDAPQPAPVQVNSRDAIPPSPAGLPQGWGSVPVERANVNAQRVARAGERLAEYNGGQSVPLVEVEPQAAPYRFVRALGRSLGKNVVYVARPDGQNLNVNGFFDETDPNTIVVDARHHPSKSIQDIFVHEWGHAFRRDPRTDPRQVAKLDQIIEQVLPGLTEWGRKTYTGMVDAAAQPGKNGEAPILSARDAKALKGDKSRVAEEGTSESLEVINMAGDVLRRIATEDPGFIRQAYRSMKLSAREFAAKLAGSGAFREKVAFERAAFELESVFRSAMGRKPGDRSGGATSDEMITPVDDRTGRKPPLVHPSFRGPATDYGYWYDPSKRKWTPVGPFDHEGVGATILQQDYGADPREQARARMADDTHVYRETFNKGLVRVVAPPGGNVEIHVPHGKVDLNGVTPLVLEALKDGRQVRVERNLAPAQDILNSGQVEQVPVENARDWMKFIGTTFPSLRQTSELHGEDWLQRIANRPLATVENVPNPSTGSRIEQLPLPERQRYTAKVESFFHDATGQDVLAKQVGIRTGRTLRGPGVYLGQENPGRQIPFVVPKEMLGPDKTITPDGKRIVEGWLAARGLLTGQAAMAYHKPTPAAGEDQVSAVDFAWGKGLRQAEVKPLYDQLVATFGADAGAQLAIIPMPHGVRVLNTAGVDPREFRTGIEAAAERALTHDMEAWEHSFDGGYFENDWSAKPDGQDYLAKITATGSSGLQGELQRLRPAIDKVRARFEPGDRGDAAAAVSAAQGRAFTSLRPDDGVAAPLPGPAIRSPEELIHERAVRMFSAAGSPDGRFHDYYLQAQRSHAAMDQAARPRLTAERERASMEVRPLSESVHDEAVRTYEEAGSPPDQFFAHYLRAQRAAEDARDGSLYTSLSGRREEDSTDSHLRQLAELVRSAENAMHYVPIGSADRMRLERAIDAWNHRRREIQRRAGETRASMRTPYDTPEVLAERERLTKLPPTSQDNSPERNELRKRIGHDYYGKGAPVKNHEAWLVIGPPGAGKSTLIDGITKRHGAMLIDSDEIKAMLPEYDGGRNAMQVHEESSKLSRAVIEQAVSNGDNFAFPFVGWDAKGVEYIRKALVDAGYRTHLRLVHVGGDVAAKRALDRWLKTGRFVDPVFIHEVVADRPIKTYEQVKNLFDTHEAYDNEGPTPKLIDSSHGSTGDFGGLTPGELRSRLDAGDGDGGGDSRGGGPTALSSLRDRRAGLPENIARQIDHRTGREVEPADPLHPKPSEIAWVKGISREQHLARIASLDKQDYVGGEGQVYFNGKMQGFVVAKPVRGIEDMFAAGPSLNLVLKDVDFWIDKPVVTENHARFVGTVEAFDVPIPPDAQKVKYDPYVHRYSTKVGDHTVTGADRVVVTQKGMFATGLKGEDGKPLGNIFTSIREGDEGERRPPIPPANHGYWFHPGNPRYGDESIHGGKPVWIAVDAMHGSAQTRDRILAKTGFDTYGAGDFFGTMFQNGWVRVVKEDEHRAIGKTDIGIDIPRLKIGPEHRELSRIVGRTLDGGYAVTLEGIGTLRGEYGLAQWAQMVGTTVHALDRSHLFTSVRDEGGKRPVMEGNHGWWYDSRNGNFIPVNNTHGDTAMDLGLAEYDSEDHTGWYHQMQGKGYVRVVKYRNFQPLGKTDIGIDFGGDTINPERHKPENLKALTRLVGPTLDGGHTVHIERGDGARHGGVTLEGEGGLRKWAEMIGTTVHALERSHLFTSVRREPLKGFYFDSAEAVKQKFPKAMQAKDVPNWLAQRGIKKNEIKWLFLDDLVGTGKNGQVTKEDLLRHIDDHGVRLEEVEQYDRVDREGAPRADGLELRGFTDQPRIVPPGDLSAGRERYVAIDQSGTQHPDTFVEYDPRHRLWYGSTTNTGTYQQGVAGFVSRVDAEREAESHFNENHEEDDYDDSSRDGYSGRRASTDARWTDYVKDDGNIDGYVNLVLRLDRPAPVPTGSGEYSNSDMKTHWGDTNNVVAHVRATERGSTLVVEELQSDWAKSGKKKGYTDPAEIRRRTAELDVRDRELSDRIRPLREAYRAAEAAVDAHNNAGIDTHNEGWAAESNRLSAEAMRAWNELSQLRDERREVATELQSLGKDYTPLSPFPDDDDWLKLTIKRVIRYAAENGFKSVAFTTGDQQASIWSEDYRVFYEMLYDQKVPKIADKYVKKLGGHGWVGLDDGGAYSYADETRELPGFGITPAMKATVAVEPAVNRDPADRTAPTPERIDREWAELRRLADEPMLPGFQDVGDAIRNHDREKYLEKKKAEPPFVPGKGQSLFSSLRNGATPEQRKSFGAADEHGKYWLNVNSDELESAAVGYGHHEAAVRVLSERYGMSAAELKAKLYSDKSQELFNDMFERGWVRVVDKYGFPNVEIDLDRSQLARAANSKLLTRVVHGALRAGRQVLVDLEDRTGQHKIEAVTIPAGSVEGMATWRRLVSGELHGSSFSSLRNNPAETRTGRRLVEQVDAGRDADPEVRHDEEVAARADHLLGSKARIEDLYRKVRSGSAGQLDDAETVAAKRLVADAVRDPRKLDDRSLRRVVDLVDGYRETGREQARAFRQRGGNAASTDPTDRLRNWIADAVFNLPSKSDRRTRNKPAARAAARADWATRVRNLFTDLRDGGVDLFSVLADPSKHTPAELAKVVREVQTRKSDAGDMLYEAWINGILSMPTTHAANVVGNATNVALEYALNRPVEMALNTLVRSSGAASFGELPHLLKRVPKAVMEAGRNYLAALATESPSFERSVTAGSGTEKTEIPKSIPGVAGQAVRFLGGRLLTAEDEFFKALVANLEVASHAHRLASAEKLEGKAFRDRMDQLIDTPGSEAWLGALDDAKRLTFQTEAGEGVQKFVALRDWTHERLGKLPVPMLNLKYAVPFTTTLANLMGSGFRKTPLYTPVYAAQLMRHATQVATGRETSKSARQLMHGFADQALAYTILAALAAATKDDDKDDDELPVITGTVPWKGTSRGERDLKARTVPAMSVRVGDKTISYARWEPFATSVAATIDLLKEARRGGDAGDVLTRAGGKVVSLLKEKSFAHGIAEIVDALSDTRYVADFVSKYYTGFVPNVVRGAARATDEYVRDSKVAGKGDDFYADLADKTKYRAFPSAGSAPPPQVTPYGEDVRKHSFGKGKAADVAYRMLSPFEVRDVNANEIDRLFLKWNEQHPDAPKYPGKPDRDYSVGGVSKLMDEQTYHRYAQETGREALRILRTTRLNAEAPTEDDLKKVAKVFAGVRKKWRKDNLSAEPETSPALSSQ